MRSGTLFIVMTVVLDAMGIGLILPIMPELLQEVQGGSLANAALWGGVLSTVFALMQFVFGPVVGNLSDRYGRRPVLLVSLFFMALDYLVMALAGSIWLLLLGRLVGGITAATHATASAYMADISTPEQKAANFGLIGAGFGIGFVLGPLVGGMLGEMGTRAPFYAAAALAALNFFFGLLVLRETVTDTIRRPFEWRRANPLGAFRQIGAHPELRRLLVVLFLYDLALYVYPAVWSYFGQARFGWTPQLIGLSLALYGIAAAAVQIWLIRWMIARQGERGTAQWGIVFEALACVMLAVVTSGPLALILTPIASLGAVAMPALQGMLSRRTGADAQGELQGVIASVHALAAIASPMLMTSTFAAFTAEGARLFFPGAPFVLAALLLALSVLVIRRTPRTED
ncbi:TCR/Tet family MFS transporter [Seohaeicola zhoushanensis]|uniref:Tetracycline resistance MFS efflux pump n=1 Tax=Seohaeicola zhoushanensis TaxID=1569283 RepID=A0A8J3GXK1_9RHOB|nr:TCR/Tet family MFS transporter [Seohaeicola zhoushanensis]GHF54162.1 tetracycline resistance MFS efflux pump [Seohaeicola zhoushanensis]